MKTNEMVNLVAKLALCGELTRQDIADLTPMQAGAFITACQVIPWLNIEHKVDERTYRFIIDQELKDICDGKRSRDEWEGRNAIQQLAVLEENIKAFALAIDQKRAAQKEWRKQFTNPNWSTPGVQLKLAQEQIDVFDAELTKLLNLS